MKKCYKCDFCDEVYESKEAAAAHEENCGYNPKNKITVPVFFRLGMIYNTLPKIISCALYETAKEDLLFLYEEAKRVSETNCPFFVYDYKRSILNALVDAEKCYIKQNERKKSMYDDVLHEYPEIFHAVVDTLNRKAWNER